MGCPGLSSPADVPLTCFLLENWALLGMQVESETLNLYFDLLENMLYFPLLVLKGIYHYCFLFLFMFSRALKQMAVYHEFGMGFGAPLRCHFVAVATDPNGYGSIFNHQELDRRF